MRAQNAPAPPPPPRRGPHHLVEVLQLVHGGRHRLSKLGVAVERVKVGAGHLGGDANSARGRRADATWLRAPPRGRAPAGRGAEPRCGRGAPHLRVLLWQQALELLGPEAGGEGSGLFVAASARAQLSGAPAGCAQPRRAPPGPPPRGRRPRTPPTSSLPSLVPPSALPGGRAAARQPWSGAARRAGAAAGATAPRRAPGRRWQPQPIERDTSMLPRDRGWLSWAARSRDGTRARLL
jgi:hypothetical protein